MADATFSAFHKRLLKWYRAHGRKDLPWRNTRDAYAIYISEIMLQQTQVKTVLERYYHPFLKQFPTVEALANAKEQAVLKAWQGLGYYNRAINLHRAAKEMGIRDWGLGIGGNKKSSLTSNPQSLIPNLMSLPGIGRNTAHAVAAFAYHAPVAVMEANVKRVLCRIFAMENPAPEMLWEKAGALLDHKHPFDYNQAMMDIGAMVCTKRAPDCPHCPANGICKGQVAPERYPTPKTKKTVPVRKHIIIVQQNAAGEIFVQPRAGKFLSGLYEFGQGTPKKSDAHLGNVRQQYSHFTLEAEIYMRKVKGSGEHWHSAKKLRALPFSMAEMKILALLPGAKPGKQK